jgi:hypothetical protein
LTLYCLRRRRTARYQTIIPTLTLAQASIPYLPPILSYIFPGDATWEQLANVNDCAVIAEYLVHCDVNDPIRLPKHKYVINVSLKATNK